MSEMTPAELDILEKEAFDQGTKVAQIFSGIFFTGLAVWLSTTNGTRLSFVQKASLEKRLTVCCFFNVYVGIFSAFFNFFQLTEVDDLLLPTQGQFNLDLSRPIEWVLTCPLMQVTLVLMGGSKLPEYRRYLMPAIPCYILTCGTASMFMTDTIPKLLCYVAGLLGFSVMTYFLRLQILEYSNNTEGFLTGDSEFRKATLLLLSTWFPFPCWFIMSPEGFGLIDNVLVIQVGWAFLNIVSKFVFIFYIQRVKDLYCNRLKTKRELVGHKPAFLQVGGPPRHGAMSPPDLEFTGAMTPAYDGAQAYELADQERKKERLAGIVIETMSFLGMAQNTDRFQRLLDQADITTCDQAENLTKADCERLSLPFELVSALQRRLQVWKLEMVDDAEMGLEKGEEHYLKKMLDMPQLGSMTPLPPGSVTPQQYPMQQIKTIMQSGDATTASASTDEMVREVGPALTEAKIEEILRKAEENILEGQQARAQNYEKACALSLEAVAKSLRADFAAMEKRLSQQIEATSKTTERRAEERAFESRMNYKLDEQARDSRQNSATLERLVGQQLEQQVGLVSAKVDACCQKVELCCQKVDACSAAQANLEREAFAGLERQLEASSQQSTSGIELLLQHAEAMQACVARHAGEAETAWSQRFEELENSMIVREDQQEAIHAQRHEELLKHSVVKRVDALASQLDRLGQKTTDAAEGLGSSLGGELQAVAARLAAKADAVHAASLKRQAESESILAKHAEGTQRASAEATARTQHVVEALEGSLQKRLQQAVEEATQRVATEMTHRVDKSLETWDSGLHKRLQHLVEQAVAQGASQAGLQGGQRAEKAVAALDSGLQRRLDEALARATSEAVVQGAALSTQRVEKAVESLESTQRSELASAMTGLLERVDDAQASQLRKFGEREDRNARRFEELLDSATHRSLQKTEEIGLDLRKELHGFAKRLNSKIPFM